MDMIKLGHNTPTTLTNVNPVPFKTKQETPYYYANERPNSMTRNTQGQSPVNYGARARLAQTTPGPQENKGSTTLLTGEMQDQEGATASQAIDTLTLKGSNNDSNQPVQFCCFCADIDQIDHHTHMSRDCDKLRRLETSEIWASITRHHICCVCLEENHHPYYDCLQRELLGRCKKCHLHHSLTVDCNPHLKNERPYGRPRIFTRSPNATPTTR